MTTENNENEKDVPGQNEFRHVITPKGIEVFRDDEGDGGKEVKKSAEPIDKLKAAGFLKKKIEGYAEEITPEIDPAETLTGMIVEEKYSDENIERVRDMRKRADSFMKTADINSAGPLRSREMSSAVTSFQVARQFMGKIMQQLGSENPYNGQTQLADAGDIIEELGVTSSQVKDTMIEILRSFRDRVQDLITDFDVYCTQVVPGGPIEMASQMGAMQELLKGKFWLGEVLADVINS